MEEGGHDSVKRGYDGDQAGLFQGFLVVTRWLVVNSSNGERTLD